MILILWTIRLQMGPAAFEASFIGLCLSVLSSSQRCHTVKFDLFLLPSLDKLPSLIFFRLSFGFPLRLYSLSSFLTRSLYQLARRIVIVIA